MDHGPWSGIKVQIPSLSSRRVNNVTLSPPSSCIPSREKKGINPIVSLEAALEKMAHQSEQGHLGIIFVLAVATLLGVSNGIPVDKSM